MIIFRNLKLFQGSAFKRTALILVIMLFVASSVFSETLLASKTDNTIEEIKKENIINTVVGKSIVITLESNKTTGYEWQLAKPINEKIIKFKKSEYKPYETGLVGSGGIETWTFEAISPGKTTILFKYVRPWEKDVPPAKETSFNVIIVDKSSSQHLHVGGRGTEGSGHASGGLRLGLVNKF